MSVFTTETPLEREYDFFFNLTSIKSLIERNCKHKNFCLSPFLSPECIPSYSQDGAFYSIHVFFKSKWPLVALKGPGENKIEFKQMLGSLTQKIKNIFSWFSRGFYRYMFVAKYLYTEDNKYIYCPKKMVRIIWNTKVKIGI